MTNMRHKADAARLPNSLPDARVSTRSAPEFRIGRTDRAAIVLQPRPAIERQAQWSVEIDDVGLLCDQQRRRDPKRRADRATDHHPQAPPLRYPRQRLGQPTRFVELDIDGLVFPVEPVEIGKRPADSSAHSGIGRSNRASASSAPAGSGCSISATLKSTSIGIYSRS